MRRWLAVVLLAAVACGGNGTTKADQARSIASSAGLPKEVADFFALAASGLNATYRVTYSSADATGQALQITTTRRSDDVRIDSFHADGSVDSTIATGGRSYQCTKSADHWDCGELGDADNAGDIFDATAARDLADRFKQRANDYDFRLEDRTIANVNARCMITTRKAGHDNDPALGASATLCLSPEGAIVAVEVPSGSVTATDYTTTIPSDAFDLPASPTTTTSTPSTSVTSTASSTAN